MPQPFPPTLEHSGELLAWFAARRALEDAERVPPVAQRRLVRALREAGADPGTISAVEGAARPSLVPANLLLAAEQTAATEVVRASQRALVDALVAALMATDLVDKADEDLDGVLPAAMRGARPVLVGMAVPGYPIHDVPAFTVGEAQVLSEHAICGRPRTQAHRPVGAGAGAGAGAGSGAAAAAGDGATRGPCGDCRALRRHDGPFEPEVAPIRSISSGTASGRGEADARPDPKPDARPDPKPDTRSDARGVRASADAAHPTLHALPSRAEPVSGDDTPGGAARVPGDGPGPAPTYREPLEERHPRAHRALVVLRMVVALAILVLVLLFVVSRISGRFDPFGGLLG